MDVIFYFVYLYTYWKVQHIGAENCSLFLSVEKWCLVGILDGMELDRLMIVAVFMVPDLGFVFCLVETLTRASFW